MNGASLPWWIGDGSRASSTPCSLCAELGVECKFTGVVAKRRTYVDLLEERVEQAERKMQEIKARPAPASSNTPYRPKSEGPGPGVEIAALSIRSMNVAAPSAHPDDVATLGLIHSLQALSMSDYDDEHFHGEPSGLLVMRGAFELREKYEQKEMKWTARRGQYWQRWFSPRTIRNGSFVFAPPTLMLELVELYFEHHNPYIPLLHRPTFERDLLAGLHLRDEIFGGVVQMVCAIASRFSDNPQVSPPGADELTRGYAFSSQVTLSLEHIFSRPTLHQVQLHCLCVMFSNLTNPMSQWSIVGAAFRMIQDVGAHQRPQVEAPPSVESELWKRAFWVCMTLDRQLGITAGRPNIIHWEEFDVDLPLEVDDEYWEDGFSQPEGTTSSVVYFNQHLKLDMILGLALETLYSLQKSKALLAHRDPDWASRIVAELDSALNNWLSNVPKHLRWDETMTSQFAISKHAQMLVKQSASLHCHYHLIQIVVHRQFIPQLRLRLPGNQPSLAVCTNAARSSAHIIHKLSGLGVPVFPNVLYPAFLSALILALNVWSGQRTGLPPHMNSSLAEVRMCMDCFKIHERRFGAAGLIWDLVSGLISMEDMPAPSNPITTTEKESNTRKRRRQEAYPASQSPFISTPDSGTPSSDDLDCILEDLNVSGSGEWYQGPAEAFDFPEFSLDEELTPVVESKILGLWSGAPTTLEMEDWSAYFDSLRAAEGVGGRPP
ncbi:Fungal-trans domain-containing protein [Mycena chlorophos]|uniref:Fungal-trans domain-containing protein n=1 Tax=Mycena chlorophos TaxID=658473 RepID=A0A8H6WE88_MYCCL|nr:Fungal-trans domain-containing protein [Mycena chlorophos]